MIAVLGLSVLPVLVLRAPEASENSTAGRPAARQTAAAAQDAQRPEFDGAAAWLENPKSVNRSDWPLLNSPEWDTVLLKSDMDGRTIEQKRIDGGYRACILGEAPHYHDKTRLERVTLQNLECFAQPEASKARGSKWGFRLYGVADLIVQDVWFHDIHGNPSDGHAVYLTISGPVTFERIRVDDCGGQAIQIVNREWSRTPEAPPVPPETEVVIRDVLVRNVGFNPSRGAYALTMRGLGPEVDALIERADIEVSWDEPQQRNGRRCRSAGGIVVAGPDMEPVNFPAKAHCAREVVIRDCRVALTEPFNALLQVNNVASLLIENCHFSGGRILLDEYEGPSGRIVVRNCSGNATIFHRQRAVGPVIDGFEYTRPQ